MIGSLVVGMSVKTDKMKKGFDKTRGTLSKFKSSVFSLKGAVVGLGAAIGAGALLTGLKWRRSGSA